MKTLKFAIAAAVLTFTAFNHAAADEMADAMDALCVKMKDCAIEQMGNTDEMNEDMKAMVMQSLNSMCEGIERNYQSAEGHALYPAAVACLQSMQTQSCQQLSAGDDTQTPECVAYREEAKQYE